MNSLQRFISSFTLPFYKSDFNIITGWQSFRQILILWLLLSVLSALSIYFAFQKYNEILPSMLRDFPEFKITGGKFETKDKLPAAYKILESKKENSALWIVLDKSEEPNIPTEINKDDSYILISAENFKVVKSNGSSDKSVSLASINKSFGDPIIVNKNYVKGFFDNTFMIMTIAFIVLTALGLLFSLPLAALFGGIIVFMINAILNWQKDFAEIYKICCYAAAPAFVFGSILKLGLSSQIPLWLTFEWILFLGLSIYAASQEKQKLTEIAQQTNGSAQLSI